LTKFVESYKKHYTSDVVESAIKEAESRILREVVDRVVAAAEGKQVEEGAQEKLSPKNIC
jgi:hypothetical protein